MTAAPYGGAIPCAAGPAGRSPNEAQDQLPYVAFEGDVWIIPAERMKGGRQRTAFPCRRRLRP